MGERTNNYFKKRKKRIDKTSVFVYNIRDYIIIDDYIRIYRRIKEFFLTMNITSKRKILTALLSVFAIIALVLSLTGMRFAYAVASPTASRYFSYEVKNGNTVSNVAFENDNIVIPLNSTEDVKTVKDVVIEKFRIEFSVELFNDGNPTAREFTFKIDADSFDDNGCFDGEKYVKTADNTVKFTCSEGNKIAVNFNGAVTSVAVNAENKNLIVLDLTVEDNFINAKVNGTEVSANKTEKYKVAVYDKLCSRLHFINSGEDAYKVTLKSVDTNTDDTNGNYKQTFKLSETGASFNEYARPRFTANKAVWNNGTVLLGRENSFTFTSHSFLGNTLSTDVYVTLAEGTDALVGGNNRSLIKFNREGAASFNLMSDYDTKTTEKVATVYETFNLNVVRDTGNAPAYNFDANALASFKAALADSVFADKETGKYITLGTDKTLKIPSMRNIVADDATSYDNLKYTIYYKTPNGESSKSSELTIPVESEGKYIFYVVFRDESGNSMKTYDFLKTDVNNADKYTYGVYKDYIFEFEVFDDSEMKIRANEQSEGFVGVQYTASAFDIKASNYETEYKLYYSATEIAADANGWTEIIKAEDAKDTGKKYNGYTYSEIKAIAFNGELKFVPTVKGYYKISCNVNSKASVRSMAAESVIKIQKEPVHVTNKDFFADNVGSVVFLGIGTLCLIGIVILLCIKPKDAATVGGKKKSVKKK